jgi:hypothetical protein
MKLTFKYPFEISILGNSPEDFEFSAKFESNGYLILVSFDFLNSKPSILKKPDYIFGYKYILFTKSLNFKIEESKKKNLKNLSVLIIPDNHPDLLEFLTIFINKVLNAIRNFGMVAEVNEIHPEKKETEYHLRYWNIEIIDNEDKKKKLFPDDVDFPFFLDYIYKLKSSTAGENPLMYSHTLPDIIERIEDDISIPPEKEFLTNAIGFWRSKNYRMAVVESIIGLEIVLSQFLRAYLKKYTSIQKKEIKDFLFRIGLKHKISVVLKLPFVLSENLKYINFSNVIEVISWRNDIVHEKGKLDSNLKNGELRDGISSVITLANILARQREQIKYSSDFEKISNTIEEKYKESEYYIPKPAISFGTFRHHITVKFTFIPPVLHLINKKLPPENIIEQLAHELSNLILKLDKRFDVKKHLHISFRELTTNEIYARYYNGKVEILKEYK